jgi:hypothetical protein
LVPCCLSIWGAAWIIRAVVVEVRRSAAGLHFASSGLARKRASADVSITLGGEVIASGPLPRRSAAGLRTRLAEEPPFIRRA